MNVRPPRVVVVGGGFGGLYAATYLARSELADREATITLVDRKSYFTFTPLLAEVAAGSLGTEHLIYPYRVLGRRYGFHFVRDEVRGIDLDAQVLRTAHSEISFDYLVVALGTEPRYFGNDCVREHSLALTTVNDAVAIRNRVLDCLERAVLSRGADARSRLLTFVVAGAGPAR